MTKYVHIGIGRSKKAYNLIVLLGYENRCRRSLSGDYVVTIEREDAPAFIGLIKENGVPCQYI